MAAAKNRVNNGQQYRRRGSAAQYVYGNVAVEAEPGYHEQSPEKPKKKVSKQVRKNRNQALHMNSAYVIFLTVAAVMAVIVCVNYVKLQSRITDRSKNITAMQKELADRKSVV